LNVQLCMGSRVIVVDRDPRPRRARGTCTHRGEEGLRMEGAFRVAWWDRVVLPSLVGGCVLTRGGGAEWGVGPVNP